MSVLEDYIESRAKFARTKGVLQTRVKNLIRAVQKIQTSPRHATVDEPEGAQKKFYNFQSADWIDLADMKVLLNRFQSEHTAMDAAYNALSPDQKAGMATPESSSIS